jgi:hypothetical protein
MCDFNLISALILAAQVAFLASLIVVGTVMVLGSNPFTSPANIPAMITAAVLSGIATGSMIGAIVALDSCSTGPCGATLVDLRANLIFLSAAMGTYAAFMVGLAIVAPLPWVSSGFAAGVIAWAASIIPVFAAYESGRLVNTIQAFNDCLQRNSNSGNDTLTTVVVVASVGVAIVGLLVGGGSAYKTKPPIPKWW